MSWIRFLFTSGARLKRRVTLTLLAGIVCLVGLLSVAWAAALSTQDFAAINKLASSEPDAKTFLKAFEQAKNAINSDEEIPAEARTRLIAIISGDELTEDYKNDLKEAGLSDELLGQIEGLNKGAKAIQKELASASETVTAVRRETTASATARSEASATANNEPTQDEIFKFIEEKNPSLAAQVDAYMKGTVAKTDDGILTPSQMNEIPNNVLKLLKSNKDLEGVAQATVNQIISMHEAAIDSVRADAFANNTFNFESEKLNEVLGANPNLVQFLEQAAKGLLVENKAEGITGVSNFLRDYYAFNDAQLAKVTESLKTNVIDQNEVPVASSGKNIFKTLLKDNMEYVSFTPYSPKEREDVVAAVKKQVAESGNDTLTKQNLKDAMLALDSWRILDQQQFVEGEETRWDLTTIDLALASNVAIQQDYTRFWTGGDFTDKQITVLQNKLKHLYQSKMPRMTDEQYAALWKNLETKRSIFLQLKKDDAQAYSSLLSFVNGKNFTASEEDKLMTALKTAAVATQQAAGKIDGVEKATPNKAYARYLVAEVKTQRSVNMAWNPVQGVYSHPDLKDSDNHAALDTVEVKFFLNNLKKLSVAGQSFGANFFVNYKMPMPRVAQVARDARVQSGLVVFDKYLDT